MVKWKTIFLFVCVFKRFITKTSDSEPTFEGLKHTHKYTQPAAYAHICTQKHICNPQGKQETKEVLDSTISPAFTAYVFLGLSVFLVVSILVLVLLKCLQCIRNVKMNHFRKQYRRCTTSTERRNIESQQYITLHLLITWKILS